ncbi:hypothetical protein ACQPYV_31480 [Micromonospora saelicesensis]|uniref:hypothetical protein n=1 Tax=Micromonospora saelicesensis TaxID=285676 RepID=UPI003D8A3959
MNEDFRNVYRELADDARNYSDPERALAVGHRRRRTMLAAPALAVAVAVVAVGTWVTLRPPIPTGTPGNQTTASSPVPTLSPPPNAPALPPGAVGRASFAYAGCRSGCPGLAVVGDRQFIIPGQERNPGSSAMLLSLSPDGRWLGYPAGDSYVVRDLTGTRTMAFPPSETGRRMAAWVWSADSKRLLVGDFREGNDNTYTLVDVLTGGRTPAVIPAARTPLALTNEGEVVSRARDQQPEPVRVLTLTVSAIGDATGRSVAIDASAILARSESLFPGSVLVHPDGGGYLLGVGTADGISTGVLRVAADGRVVERVVDVPRDNREFWNVLGVNGDGLLLSRQTNAGRQATTVVAVTGRALRDLVALPHESIVAVPGASAR